MGVLGAAEEVDERPHHREQGGLLAAQLLGEPLPGGPHRPGDRVRVRFEGGDRVAAFERRRDGGQEHRAALVARPDLEAALPARERERRVAEADVPAGIAPRILERRGEQRPEPFVERSGERGDRVAAGLGPGGAGDRDPAGGEVGLRSAVAGVVVGVAAGTADIAAAAGVTCVAADVAAGITGVAADFAAGVIGVVAVVARIAGVAAGAGAVAVVHRSHPDVDAWTFRCRNRGGAGHQTKKRAVHLPAAALDAECARNGGRPISRATTSGS